MSSEPGKLIVLCGIDGSGKSTQETKLATALTEAGIDFILTKQPTDWYREIPAIKNYLKTGKTELAPDTVALLSAADRMLHINTVVEPSLRRGVSVISNRYVYSAYGYLALRGVDPEFIKAINSRAPQPDLGIMIRIDPYEAVARIAKRDADKANFEEKDPRHLAKVQHEMLRLWPDDFLVVDGSQPAKQIAQQVANYVLTSFTTLAL